LVGYAAAVRKSGVSLAAVERARGLAAS